MKKNKSNIKQKNIRKYPKRRKKSKSKMPLILVLAFFVGIIIYGCSNIDNFNGNTTDSTPSSQDTSDSSSPEESKSQSPTPTPTVEPTIDPIMQVPFFIDEFVDRYKAFELDNPQMSVEEVVLMVNMNFDYGFYENISTIEDPENLLVLVNKFYKLPEGFTPKNLEPVPSEYYIHDGKTYLLDSNALDAFVEMAKAAKLDGLELRIISAYRSIQYQRDLYETYAQRDGYNAADTYSARAGHSEHNTGLAVDINLVSQTFEDLPEFMWLKENSYKYGYILRYLKEKEHITGYIYEPWHYRYVGVETAKEVYELGITYDEYYAKYILPSKYN